MRRIFLPVFCIVLLILVIAAIPAFAQSQDKSKHPGLEIRLTGGAFRSTPILSDEMGATGPGFGGSVRYYLSQRFALEMELLYSWGQVDYKGPHYKMVACVPMILYHVSTRPKEKANIYIFAGIGYRRVSFEQRTDHFPLPDDKGIGAWFGLGLKQGGRIFYSLEVRYLGLAASVGYAFK